MAFKNLNISVKAILLCLEGLDRCTENVWFYWFTVYAALIASSQDGSGR